MDRRSIGFIGLGRMGSGMARNLLKAGHHVTLFDHARDVLDRFDGEGAQAATSPMQLAGDCDLVFLCLPAAGNVRDVIFGKQGLSRAEFAETFVIVDTTTMDRTDALAIGAECSAMGIGYSDCPISGLPFRADNGTLTVMFGGASQTLLAARPYLEAFSDDIIHAGGLGAGQAMKAINNIIYNVNIAALCEVLPLAVAVGLEPRALVQLVTSASSRSFASEYFVPRMLDRRFDADFAMRDAYKDIVNVQRMAVETRASLPVVNAMIATYQAALADGHGAEPKSAMIKVYEKALGVQFAEAGTPAADNQD